MTFASGKVSKLEYASTLAAAISFLVLRQNDAVAMEVRRDVHALGKDVESIIDASHVQAASEITSPLAFTSAAALAGAAGPSDVDALLSERPIDFQSRVQR